MKKIVALLTGLMMLVFTAGCGGGDSSSSDSSAASSGGKDGKQITMGFSQLGAESEW